MRILTRAGFLAGLVVVGLVSPCLTGAVPARAAEPATVFAAASLKNALDEIAAAYGKTGKPAPKISYAASNTLAKQIEQGAPADLFFSADLDWMDYLAKKDLIRPDTRVNLLANSIVLIAPKESRAEVRMGPGLDLAGALGSGRLAMGNVEAVPAGKYGKAALEKLGAWAGVKDRVAQAESVRAALLLVSRGEAPLGIVYATDAAADANVRVVATFPADSHPPIVYPVAITKDSVNPDAAALLADLRGPAARAAFEKQGFTVLDRPAAARP
ncbi:molybdate ABC transporter substrate-binding protein [Methylobacterium sp. J-068]|uniref:molybdate ABC transporter substrate-binding protein n=1 Tax=Methylobacterium sp. J-068 TaxID=2836649 RepID=UPI001FBB3353|nr:molybdate ABC transporter substrate-binding protein [Methylobacterium sp. J-068]MCJ2035957.1 molybdate ABC transporter substrate-binding protein [Methylobacterium sp. J-068]